MARSAPRYFKAQGGLWLIGWPPDIFGASVPAFPGGWEGEDVLQTPDCIAHRKKITTSEDVVISGKWLQFGYFVSAVSAINRSKSL